MYLLPYLEYPTDNQPEFTDEQAILMAVSAYFCILIFSLLLGFALYNTWQYLLKQGKWRVFSLSMFYGLAIICLSFRILVYVLSVYVAQWLNVSLVLFPAVLKICIGIVQVAVIVEITMRVRESLHLISVMNKRQRLQARNFMNEVMASQKRADCYVLLFRIFVFLLVISILTWTLTVFIRVDQEYRPGDADLRRASRQEYQTSTVRKMSFGFLILSLLLVASVIILMRTLAKGKQRLSNLSSAFSSEANHLSCILLFFCSTYTLRFLSDYLILPKLQERSVPCVINQDHLTECVTLTFILYYMYSSLLFDFAPLSVIIYFHHRSFRGDSRRRLSAAASGGSVMSTNNEMSPNNEHHTQ